MRAEFTVVIEGSWIEGDASVRHSQVEKALRKAIKDEFEFLAKTVSVKKVKHAKKDIPDYD